MYQEIKYIYGRVDLHFFKFMILLLLRALAQSGASTSQQCFDGSPVRIAPSAGPGLRGPQRGRRGGSGRRVVLELRRRLGSVSLNWIIIIFFPPNLSSMGTMGARDLLFVTMSHNVSFVGTLVFLLTVHDIRIKAYVVFIFHIMTNKTQSIG